MAGHGEAEILRGIIDIQQAIIEGLNRHEVMRRIADLARQATEATGASVTCDDQTMSAGDLDTRGEPTVLKAPMPDGRFATIHVANPSGEGAQTLSESIPLLGRLLQDATQLDAYRRRDDTYRLILDRSSDVVWHVDSQGTILWASPSIETLLGCSPGEAVGMSAWQFIRADRRDAFRDAVNDAVRTGEELRGEYPFLAADGRTIWVDALSTVVRHDGDFTRITRLRDVSSAHVAAESLRRSEETLRKTMENAPVGMCLIAPDGSFMTANQALCTLLDRPETELLRTTWQELTHPDDLEIDLAHVQDVLDGRLDGYRMVKRYLRPDGGIVWGDLSVSCVRDNDHKVEFFISQIADITEIKQRQMAAERAVHRYRMAAENTSDVVIQVDPHGSIVWASPNCEELISRSAEELTGGIPVELLPEHHRGKVMSHVSQLLSSREEGHFQTPILRPDGTQVWVDVASTPMYDEHGTYLGRNARLRDISEEVALREDLERRATHDPLTGLLTRDEGYRRLVAILDHKPRGDALNLLAFIDVDSLKSVNDDHGHEAGDELLRIVADRIRSRLRSEDIVVRIGGDEMIAILSGVRETSDGLAVLEDVVHRVHREYRYRGRELSPSVSIGVTVLQPGEKADAALRRADACMYEAKRSGGNAVCFDGAGH